MQHPLDPKSTPVVQVRRRVPVAVREKHKAELDRMEVTDIFPKVTEPTDWVISPVVVEKPKADKLCVCLDPRDIDQVTYSPTTLSSAHTRIHVRIAKYVRKILY